MSNVNPRDGHQFEGYRQGYSLTRRGIYRGLVFRVGFFSPNEVDVSTNAPWIDNGRWPDEVGGHFAYYVRVAKVQVPGDNWDRFICAERGRHGWTRYSDTAFHGLPWHYGMTFYDRGDDWAEGGCDYNHYGDVECASWEGIAGEVRETIDALHANVPGLLVRDPFTGEWAPEADASAAAKELEVRE